MVSNCGPYGAFVAVRLSICSKSCFQAGECAVATTRYLADRLNLPTRAGWRLRPAAAALGHPFEAFETPLLTLLHPLSGPAETE
ncbi:hypothetical protein ACH4PR_51885 [Streptomyces mirabilis]|uniref:hypothetical protein n=1 Tax=Streptomyces mirabilis TaxID=68239 RepID=UPI00378A4BFF